MKKFVVLCMVAGLSACTPGGVVKATEPTKTAKLKPVTTSMADFKVLDGDGWRGTLSYLNYKSPERSSIPVALSIDASNSKYLAYSIKYPGEEQYNEKAKIKISKDRSRIDGKALVRRRELSNGAIELMTAFPGKDDNRKAHIQMTYTMSANKFSMRKDVKFAGDPEFINRNEYMFER